MSDSIVVIGGGVGGLTAAISLADAGRKVVLLEQHSSVLGGLASSVEVGRRRFDGGPYVLLDRPRLEWALDQINLTVDSLALQPLDPVYEVATTSSPVVTLSRDLETTANHFEANWPGSGQQYRQFVAQIAKHYNALSPLLTADSPKSGVLTRPKTWPSVPFALRSLDQVMRASKLPEAVIDALSIWTHVAAMNRTDASSTMALVSGLIHTDGAWRPADGISAIPRLLTSTAAARGVDIRIGAGVAKITVAEGKVAGVTTDDGERIPANTVISDVGLSTYLSLLEDPPKTFTDISRWPLQSPGLCLYIKANPRRPDSPHRLRFNLDDGRCRLLVQPQTEADGFISARLIAPLPHRRAEAMTIEEQTASAQQFFHDAWWREDLADAELLGTRLTNDWGSEFRLYRNSMNPAMTRQMMRRGRLAHKSPYVKGLFMAGSATHPGQWISFSMVSGILAARQALR